MSSVIASERVPSEFGPLSRTWSLAAHELRTPVSVISGYLRMLLQDQAGPLTEQQRRILEGAASSCTRIAMLLAEMSELEKFESGDVVVPDTPVDLASLVADVSGRLHEGDDRGVRLEVRTASPVTVQGDPVRLTAALHVLVLAALRAHSGPGVVVVECGAAPDTAPGWAIVTIGDEAIDRAALSAVHAAQAPFDEWPGGLGLGLSVARRVIEAHGGSVWSTPPGARPAGSAFRLPLTTQRMIM